MFSISVNDPDGLFWIFLQLLVGLVTAFRYEGTEIDVKLAKCEAKILQDAIKDKKFNHDEVIRILTTRSKTQLLATFNHFKDSHGTSITKVNNKAHIAAEHSELLCVHSIVRHIYNVFVF